MLPLRLNRMKFWNYLDYICFLLVISISDSILDQYFDGQALTGTEFYYTTELAIVIKLVMKYLK